MALSIDKQIEELNELIRFDFDAIGAYNSAINDIKEMQIRDPLIQFRGDHERHVQNLSAIVIASRRQARRRARLQRRRAQDDDQGGGPRRHRADAQGDALERRGAQQDLRAPSVARLPRRHQAGHPPATTATSSATWRGSSRRCRSRLWEIGRRRASVSASASARESRAHRRAARTRTRTAIGDDSAPSVVPSDDAQRLRSLPRPTGTTRRPRGRELRHELIGHRRRRRGHEDRVVGRVRRQADRAVADERRARCRGRARAASSARAAPAPARARSV